MAVFLCHALHTQLPIKETSELRTSGVLALSAFEDDKEEGTSGGGKDNNQSTPNPAGEPGICSVPCSCTIYNCCRSSIFPQNISGRIHGLNRQIAVCVQLLSFNLDIKLIRAVQRDRRTIRENNIGRPFRKYGRINSKNELILIVR